MFSLELAENVIEIEGRAFSSCLCLRNVAFPANAVFGDDIFIDEEDYHEMATNADLFQLFDSTADIIIELQHQFEGLSIHRIIYYQSYNQGVLQMLIAAKNMRSGQCQTLHSNPDPAGDQQDCLGMTPLHILACSSVHDL
jgi:hypothetical protein